LKEVPLENRAQFLLQREERKEQCEK